MTDAIGDAAAILEERIAAIDRELAEQNDLRDERRLVEAALRKLRPAKRKTKPVGAELTTSERILAVVAAAHDPKAEWTLTDLISALELAGWKTASSNPLQVVRPTCDRLVRTGELKRPRGGIYTAA